MLFAALLKAVLTGNTRLVLSLIFCTCCWITKYSKRILNRLLEWKGILLVPLCKPRFFWTQITSASNQVNQREDPEEIPMVFLSRVSCFWALLHRGRTASSPLFPQKNVIIFPMCSKIRGHMHNKPSDRDISSKKDKISSVTYGNGCFNIDTKNLQGHLIKFQLWDCL